MHRNQSVSPHNFAMVPRAEIPRSSFRMQKAYKTTFDASFLVPIFCEEVLPGDSFNVRATLFARLSTPLFPVMDNLHADTFFFFVPNRLIWTNWVRFMGETIPNPNSSISYTIPQVVTPASGWPVNSLADYFGLPTVGQVAAAATVSHSALPLRAYNLIYDQWFRDENLINGWGTPLGDGPDASTSYVTQRRGKRHDYFTSCLPFVQKGTSASIPLGTLAPVRSQATDLITGVQQATRWLRTDGGGAPPTLVPLGFTTGGGAGALTTHTTPAIVGPSQTVYASNLYADLTTATAATINQLRQSFQIQKLLERDARGGTRYTEIVRSHFGVMSPDARLQRPEYLGGGSTPVGISEIPQTSATGLTGGTTPVGSLSAKGTLLAHSHGFSSSFVEHGYVIGLISVRADLTYQQGLRRHWSRSTRYDYYFPAFAELGEQAVLNKEIYVRGDANDALVFGYQERWAEYRYMPSEITGLFRSTAASTIDPWHLAQNFTALPTLGQTFIEENVPLSRILAVGAGANGKQLLLDAFFDVKAARPLPMYSVPGHVDHF